MAKSKSGFQRLSGVIFHPTSFPSPYGIGDLGQEARDILTLLSSAGLKLWQILPLGPTGYGDSPYSSHSCHAGNEYLIDLRSLPEGCFTPKTQDLEANRTDRVDYGYVASYKLPLLKQAASRFLELYPNDSAFSLFCKENASWLDDYALFRCIAESLQETRWTMWPDDIRDRKMKAMKDWASRLSSEIQVAKVLQFFFRTQWDSLHNFARNLGMRIVGDIPIYPASDSSDVWANRNLFKISDDGKQLFCAGCPGDYFDPDGQYWGNPVYDWDVHEADDFSWWRERISYMFTLVDVLRIDHFRGFESYWEIPAGAAKASEGHWAKGPGMALIKHFKGMDIIAEDLGMITDDVRKLLSQSGFPGMRVAMFGFSFRPDGSFESENLSLPHNHPENNVSYPGTHDNDTVNGWYASLDDRCKDIVRRYFQCPDSGVCTSMIHQLIAGPSRMVIMQMQDILGLGNEGRMNRPSTVGTSNWSWRFTWDKLQDWMLPWLHEQNMLYGRC